MPDRPVSVGKPDCVRRDFRINHPQSEIMDLSQAGCCQGLMELFARLLSTNFIEADDIPFYGFVTNPSAPT